MIPLRVTLSLLDVLLINHILGDELIVDQSILNLFNSGLHPHMLITNVDQLFLDMYFVA